MKARVVLVTAGTLTMGYAVAGALLDPDLDPAGVLSFLAGALIVHDLLWMPALLVAGAVVTRAVPARGRPAVQAALVVAVAVTVVALPLALGYGRPPDNPSALPLPYPRNLVVVLLLVAAGAAALHRLRRRRRAKGPAPSAAGEP